MSVDGDRVALFGGVKEHLDATVARPFMLVAATDVASPAVKEDC
jgi:hypothetical protein